MSSGFKLLPPGSRCAVTVPASTSNMGPGFDAIGCAIRLHNRFEYEILPEGSQNTVEVSGEWCTGVPANRENLALVAIGNFYRQLGVTPPPLSVKCRADIPNARGLGSSSTAVVAGLLAGNALLGSPFSQVELLDMAVEVEGHPDNVAPDIVGGLVVSASHTAPLLWRKLRVHPHFSFVFVIPHYEVATVQARSVVPRVIQIGDAIFNASRTPLVVIGLQTGDAGLLRDGMDDRLHQPARRPLFRGYDVFAEEAHKAGAAGFCVSGAGPSMLAVVPRPRTEPVIAAMKDTLRSLELPGSVLEIPPEEHGAAVTVSPAR